jgi:uncharacterized surface protein with fasciclin (FAS1) repeats
MRRLLQSIILVTILALLLTSLVTAQTEKTILTILAEDGRFTTLLAAIETTETEQAFSEGEWTLFAPTDEAFAQLGLNADNIASQLGLGQTADLLLYQAMTEEIRSDQAYKSLGDITMANGWLAGLKWYDDTMWVNDDAKVVEPDIFASNGVIHVVDHVITPPWPRGSEETEVALITSIEEAQLLKAEEAAAETDAATDADAAAEETAADEMDEAPAEETVPIPADSLLGVMVADGRFTTYLAAVGALDLILPYTEGEWTLFAPTDDAFAQLGLDAGNIATEYSVGELADLLLYHALDEEISSAEAKTMLGDITMRNGQLAGLKYFDDTLWVNDNARVITPDIIADNGVIHAVNAVIERPWPRVELIDLTAGDDAQSGDIP